MSRRGGLLLLAALLCACETPTGQALLAALEAREASEETKPAAPPEPDVPMVPLRAPEGLVARSGELRAIPLRWDPLLLAGVNGYVVERAGDRDGPFTRVAQVSGRMRTAWVDRGPGLVASSIGGPPPMGDAQTWYYRVRPTTVGGALGAEPSALASGTTAPAPAAPDEIRAYSHQPRAVPISWRASDDPTVSGYVVERSPTARGPFETVAEVDGRFDTLVVDEELGDLRVFHYRVASVNRAGGRGEPSKPVRAVTKAEPLPPIGLRVTAQALGRNALGWEPNVETDLVGYELLRRRAGVERFELVASLPGNATGATDGNVGAGEIVEYALRARDADGLTSENGIPIAVAGRDYEIETSARADEITLSWNPRENEGWVRGRVLLQGALGPTEIANVAGGRFVHRGVSPGGRYRYRVVLERGNGQRAPQSRVIEVTVPER